MALRLVLSCLLAVGWSLSLKEQAPPSRRYLVTGAAGFIGSSLCMRLKQDSAALVVGVDNFNDYYDVQLKIDRAYRIHRHGVIMHKADVCDKTFMTHLIAQYNFTHVVHLAAQAGVRYSLQHPLAYVQSNIACTINLLDIIRNIKSVKLIYASSSSVYGKTNPVPFSLAADVDQPGNLYAATKRANEVQASHYCLRYNLSAVGLRFFTVYGPWGRPDMAIYKFTEAIYKGTNLPMFTTESSEGPLSRDFTYVDDTVEGILSAIEYSPKTCGEVYNLGFGNPVSVPESIAIIEREIKKKAILLEMPRPPTEILRTWANLTETTRVFGFQPKTNLTQGIRNFVKWYWEYQDSRTNTSSSSTWYTGLLESEARRGDQQ